MIPTKPGFYWRTGPIPLQEDEGSVEQVVLVAPLVSTVPDELFFWQPGEPGAIFVQEKEGVTWAGPIPDPGTIASLLERYVGEQSLP